MSYKLHKIVLLVWGTIWNYPNLHNVTPSLLSQNPKGTDVLNLNIPPYCHISLPCITCFDINIIPQRIQTTRSHAPCCHHCHDYHYCRVDFVSFKYVTRYINSLLSHIHVNTTDLLNITCTLVATCMIIGRLECPCCYKFLLRQRMLS